MQTFSVEELKQFSEVLTTLVFLFFAVGVLTGVGLSIILPPFLKWLNEWTTFDSHEG